MKAVPTPRRDAFPSRRWLACLVILAIVPGLLGAGALSAAERIDFNRDIRPLLSNHCLVCHGPDSEERAADLRLDRVDDSRADLGGYAAIVPGDPDDSELIARVVSDDPDMRMPPMGKGRSLTQKEIDMLRRWIEQGAEYAAHWSYQTPVRPPLPRVQDELWPRNAIDYFVLAKQESLGLQHSPEADRLTLARRLAMDLTGLPPTWQEASEFADDVRADAYERFVDHLLDKDAFGERWARVWLDLARYADSAGYADDPARTIWGYRDYVIRSLNENKPFTEFTIEQIAGDLLDNPTQDQLVATAFHRNTLTNNEGGTNDEEFRNVAVVDRVNTTMAVWMGTTIACAQCHTHKYDPITQEEYFQFFALFNNTADADKRDESPLVELWSDQQREEREKLQAEIDRLQGTLNRSTPKLEAEQDAWLSSLAAEPNWQVLQPSVAESESRELQIGTDGFASAVGDEPDQATYTVRFPVNSGVLAGLRLEVPSDQTENFVLSQVRATWKPSTDQSTEARYVRIELDGDAKMIHLAELEVFGDGVNFARAGKASQSSTDYGGKAAFLNDGNTDGNFKHKSVNHTKASKNPWVEIDLGDPKPIDRIVIWNRTDGGENIARRISGYRVVLLDSNRNQVWQATPDGVPSPSGELALRGSFEIPFARAFADHEQSGFPASAVLEDPSDSKTGWAVSPKQGKPHELTLVLGKPIELGDGLLTVRLDQTSKHKQHLLARFRIAVTSDAAVVQWARMPQAIRDIAKLSPVNRSDQQQRQLAEYFRGIAPSLDPDRAKLEKARKQLSAMKPMTTVPVMQQVAEDQRRTTKVQIRGNYLSTGEEVTAGTPAAFHPLEPKGRPDRLDLAHWLVDDANPLTPRVIANRHWEQLFGVGIVPTSEEFGSQGELPTHPQLLDWLAVELRESGWDLKHLLKLMVTSATYRQTSYTFDDLQQADPFNQYYARGPRFRVSAEMVRDQALFVSGLLSQEMYGQPVNPPQPELGLKAAFGSATDWTTSEGADRYRRGIYTTWRRSSPYPSMAQFDAPNREVCTVRRIRTNTPLQALVTLNDPVYVEAAQSLARKMVDAGKSPDARIRYAFRNCLIREPSRAEIKRLSELARSAKSRFEDQPAAAEEMATDPIGPAPEDSDLAELAAWTVVSNVILNLDEMFMKR